MEIHVAFLLLTLSVTVGNYIPTRTERDAIPCIAFLVGDTSQPRISGAYASKFYKMLVNIVSRSSFQPKKNDRGYMEGYWESEKKRYIEEMTATGEDMSILAKPQGTATKSNVDCKFGPVLKLEVAPGVVYEKSSIAFHACAGAGALMMHFFKWTAGVPEAAAPCAEKLVKRLCGKGEFVGIEAFMTAVIPTKTVCPDPAKAGTATASKESAVKQESTEKETS